MGASILSVAGGAGEGLDEYMKRALVEEAQRQAAQAHAETARHNLVEEGLTGRGQNITDQWRRDNLASGQADRAAVRAETANKDNQATMDRQDKQVASTIALRSKGDNVTPEEAQMEQAHGAPSSLYGMYSVDPKTGALPKGVAVDEGGGGPKLPQDQPKQWMGTAKDKAPKTGSIRQDAKGNLIRVADDNTTSPITDAESGETVQGFHQPQVQIIDTVDENGKPVKKVVDKKAGNTFEEGPTNTTRTMIEGAQMLKPHIPILANTAGDLDKRGLFGPIMSRVRDIEARIGTTDPTEFARAFNQAIDTDPLFQTDRQVGKFTAQLGLIATGAGRVHGGARGGGSPQMYEHFRQMLSSSGSLNMFLGRLDGLQEYMDSYAAGPQASGKEPAAKVDEGDIYQQYLSRTRGKGPGQ